MTSTSSRSGPQSGDRRAQRTRSALVAAFRREVLATGFDAVTPSSLAAAASVGRSTFYGHFSSVDDVLSDTMSWLLAPIVEATLKPDLDREMVGTIEHIWEQRRISRTMLSGPARAVLERVLRRLCEDTLARQPGVRTGAPLLGSTKSAATYMSAGILAVLDAWLHGRIQGAAPEIAERLHSLGQATVRSMGNRLFED